MEDLEEEQGILERIVQPYEKEVEDPLAKFLKKHQNGILNVLLVGVIGYLGFQYYNQAILDARKEAADAFNDMRREVVAVVEGKSLTDKEKSSIEEKLNALTHERAPYNELALAYQNLYRLKTGELKDFSGALAALNEVPRSKELYSDGKIFTEMATILVLRAESDKDQAKAFAGLTEMAKSAQYLKLSAALSAAHIAESDEERETVRSILEGLKYEAPEHAAVIESELDTLG